MTTNVAVGIDGILGYSNTWSDFWGLAMVNGGSVGIPGGAVGVGVSVGTTVPKIRFKKKTVKITKKACIMKKCLRILPFLLVVHRVVSWSSQLAFSESPVGDGPLLNLWQGSEVPHDIP